MKQRGQSDEGTELQGRSPADVEVPYAKADVYVISPPRIFNTT
jgi:hypothetical protein